MSLCDAGESGERFRSAPSRLRSLFISRPINRTAQGARRGRPIAAAPCTPRLWRQNRRFAVPSAYAFRLSGRARGNIPVKPRPQPTSLWAAPACRQRFGDSDATYAAVVFSLKTKIEVAGTDESPLEIGEPENGRQGQSARDGGLRRTETGGRVEPCRRLEFAGERSAKHRFRRGAAGIAKGGAAPPLARSRVQMFHILQNTR